MRVVMQGARHRVSLDACYMYTIFYRRCGRLARVLFHGGRSLRLDLGVMLRHRYYVIERRLHCSSIIGGCGLTTANFTHAAKQATDGAAGLAPGLGLLSVVNSPTLYSNIRIPADKTNAHGGPKTK